MTDAVQISLIANATTILVVIISRIWSHYEIEKVHKATNSMKDELVAATQKKAFAEGVKSEQQKSPSQSTR